MIKKSKDTNRSKKIKLNKSKHNLILEPLLEEEKTAVYNINDIIKIKSIDWYNSLDKYNTLGNDVGEFGIYRKNGGCILFTKKMSAYCGKICKIINLTHGFSFDESFNYSTYKLECDGIEIDGIFYDAFFEK